MMVTGEQGGSGMAGCEGWPVWPVTRSRDADTDWDEQSSLTGPPGPAGAGWPMSGVARVTNLVTWRVTGAAWAAWHPAVCSRTEPGTRAVTQRAEHRRGPGYDTQYATLRPPGDIRQCHQHRDIVTKWCNATQDNNHSRELRKTLSVRVFKSFTTQQNFTPSWSFYFGPVLIFLSRRAEVYLIVSIRISQPVKSFIGAVSWARREKKVVLNPRHVQRSFELGQQWSIELLRYISFKISSWPFQNWIWKWNGWILFYATFQLIA